MAQTAEQILLRIGNLDCSASDFEYVHNKNNLGQTLDESLSLYINYKLKVLDALSEGVDTLPSLVSEWKGYRGQLARKYMTDTIANTRLLHEAYERSQYEINAAHILVAINQDDTLTAYRKIINIRNQALAGSDFSQLAKQYSDDPSAKANHGELAYFSVFRMIYPFETVAYQTEEGDISMPVRTAFGYHLIKVLHRRPVENVQPFEQVKTDLQQKIMRSDRVIPSVMVIIAKLKKEYHFTEDTTLLENIGMRPQQTILFTFAGQSYTVSDFSKSLSRTFNNFTIHQAYNNYVLQTLLNYEESRLEDKNPEFRHLVNEYHDGLLLFEASERKVWSHIPDSIALSDFYHQHARDYRWPKRLSATVYYCTDAETAGKVSKAVKNKNAGIGKLPDDLYSFFCGSEHANPCVDTVRNIFPDHVSTVASEIKWKKGCSKILEWDGKFVFLDVHAVLRPSSKTFEEARGEVLAAYQDELEDQWVTQLKSKYPVTINQAVWSTLKKKYAQ